MTALDQHAAHKVDGVEIPACPYCAFERRHRAVPACFGNGQGSLLIPPPPEEIA